MKHSVVIPLYDKRDHVGATIESLAAQHKPPDEVIVVDDASRDGSADVAARALSALARRHEGTRTELIRLSMNRGPGHARNTGLVQAGGELVSFLDADDRYQPDALSRIDAAIGRHRLDLLVLGYRSEPAGECFPDLNALGALLERLDEHVHLLPQPLRAAGHPDFMLGRASNVAARWVWLERHRYLDRPRLNEGVDFWYRVLKDLAARPGARVGLMSAPLIRFRILADSLSHRSFPDWRQIEPPPSSLRYAHSPDRDDHRLACMLGQRWLDHAMNCLPDAGQRQSFIEHHQPLLDALGLTERMSTE